MNRILCLIAAIFTMAFSFPCSKAETVFLSQEEAYVLMDTFENLEFDEVWEWKEFQKENARRTKEWEKEYGKCMLMIREVLKNTGITATVGIGTNMYLAKVGMDIVAKKQKPDQDGVRIAELDELSYILQLWTHRPLTDFWQIGPGTAHRLESRAIYTMGDLAAASVANEDMLYKMFGINAELLIDHAWG